MPQLEFNAALHEYRLDGRVLPSVTRVLSILDDWSNVQPEVLEAARQFGSHVHAACHLFNRGVLDWQSLDPALVPYVDGWRRFLADSKAVVLASEERVFHSRKMYAGTLDTLVEWNGLCLVDIKTGSAVPKTVGAQTSGYAEAYFDMTKRHVKRRYCVQLTPDGYKSHALKESATDAIIFQSCLNIHTWGAKHAA